MRRAALIALALPLATALAGCGTDSPSSPKATDGISVGSTVPVILQPSWAWWSRIRPATVWRTRKYNP
jgi:hypothetical protein